MVKGDLFSAQTSMSIMKLIFPAKKSNIPGRIQNSEQVEYAEHLYVEQVEKKQFLNN